MTDRAPRPTGRVSARVVGAARILRSRAASARTAAAAEPDPDGQHAAALRGKARGLAEAAALVERLERGLPLNGKTDRARRAAPLLAAEREHQ